MSTKRIVLTGGGSGGHFYPLIAVAESLRTTTNPSDSYKLYYLGPEPYNEQSLRQLDISFIKITSGKKRKYSSLSNLFSPFKVLIGTIKAIRKLYVIYPDVIFSKGSFTSVPVVLAAAFLRIPIVVHESDSKAGSANLLGAKFARYIAISFTEVAATFPSEKTALTGIPLRQTLKRPAHEPHATLGISDERPVIMVTGGSLGAERINNLILESLDEILPHYAIIHQTGVDREITVREAAANLLSDARLLNHYYVRGQLTGTEMHAAMSAASLIISRAGSGTIFEIAAHGKPSIIIPIPEAISHDQRTNAYSYARTGAATVLEEHNLADGLLFAEINRIMSDQEIYTKMSVAATTFSKTGAADKIASILIDIASEHN